ncbi:acyl-CoA dehydrogenase [Lysobacter sp. H23M47]|nr:acyl-CoA dehydrogenase [Lysobacter sp. H23M47]
MPGGGRTYERWTFLGRLGGWDLCLFKVLEAHYDACAILAELGCPPPAPGELWAVWAAEPPDAVLHYSPAGDGSLTGTKRWCTGASVVTHALITARNADERVLAAVQMNRAGVEVRDASWQAVGMARAETFDVAFDAVPAQLVAGNNRYVLRPGFWHGGAGIAAGWLGAARSIIDALLASQRARASGHQLVHLGAVETALDLNVTALHAVADAIDAQPHLAHERQVLQLRSGVDAACAQIITRVGRALGAGPLCQDREHARRVADLGVFTRQCHAERDLEALGRFALEAATPWPG